MDPCYLYRWVWERLLDESSGDELIDTVEDFEFDSIDLATSYKSKLVEISIAPLPDGGSSIHLLGERQLKIQQWSPHGQSKEGDPSGSVVWPSGRFFTLWLRQRLGDFLAHVKEQPLCDDRAEMPGESTRLSILELGSGTGLAGLAFASMVCLDCDCRSVLTDMEDKNLDLMRFNLQANETVLMRGGGKPNVHVEKMNWEREDQYLMDSSWDFIVGTDLVYDEDASGLVRAWQKLTQNSCEQGGRHSIILYAHQKRRVTESRFWDTLGNAGFCFRLLATSDLLGLGLYAIIRHGSSPHLSSRRREKETDFDVLAYDGQLDKSCIHEISSVEYNILSHTVIKNF